MDRAEISTWITTAGVVISAAAIVTTILLWQLDARRQRAEAEMVRRQALISRVLELAERTNRSAPYSALSKFWFNPALEWAFLLPRLYYELRPKERAVARWVAGQNRLIQAAVKPKDIAVLAATTAYTLAEWERGARKTEWFVQEIGDADPLQGTWKLSRRQRARQVAWATRTFATWWALLAGFYIASRQLKQELDKLV